MDGSLQGATFADDPAEVEGSIAARVRAILARQAMLQPGDIADDAALADLGLDSLGLVEVLFSIEEAFDISVPFNANDPDRSGVDLSTVAALIAGVEGVIAGR